MISVDEYSAAIEKQGPPPSLLPDERIAIDELCRRPARPYALLHYTPGHMFGQMLMLAGHAFLFFPVGVN